MPLSIVHVAGARPNFMKVAPVLAACRAEREFENRLVHTGQHYDSDLSDSFFADLGIPPPDANLAVGSASHAAQTARILERFEPLLLAWKPDLVLVVGDVNSTLACALCAAKLDIAVAHVEAGLRSFDERMPEEINRRLTDALSELLFVSEPSGVTNLRREGTDPARVHLVGNVMIDSLVASRTRAAASTVLSRLGLIDGEYAVLTLHRPANVDEPASLRQILSPIAELARRIPVIFPVHPRGRDAIRSAIGELPEAGGIRLVDPLGYLDFLRLVERSRLVLTDSGGLQEETTYLRVPCVTLRDNTERPITLDHGTNRLAGTSAAGIRSAIAETLQVDRDRLPGPPALWDGGAPHASSASSSSGKRVAVARAPDDAYIDPHRPRGGRALIVTSTDSVERLTGSRSHTLRAAFLCLLLALVAAAIPFSEGVYLFTLVAAMFACVLTPLWYDWHKGRLDLFAPIHVIGGIYFIYFGLGSLWSCRRSRGDGAGHLSDPLHPAGTARGGTGLPGAPRGLLLLVGSLGHRSRRRARGVSRCSERAASSAGRLRGGGGLDGDVVAGGQQRWTLDQRGQSRTAVPVRLGVAVDLATAGTGRLAANAACYSCVSCRSR